MLYAYDYLKTDADLLSTDYVYTAKDEQCKYDASKGLVKVTERTWVRDGSKLDMIQAL
jgi:hypothetical protein